MRSPPRRWAEYLDTVEHYSRGVLAVANYDFDPATGLLELTNSQDLEPLYRFPDLSCQADYLLRITRECAEVTLGRELEYLERMDRAQLTLQERLNLPAHRLSRLLLIHQTGGRLSHESWRAEFADLADEAVQAAEQHYVRAFPGRRDRQGCRVGTEHPCRDSAPARQRRTGRAIPKCTRPWAPRGPSTRVVAARP